MRALQLAYSSALEVAKESEYLAGKLNHLKADLERERVATNPHRGPLQM